LSPPLCVSPSPPESLLACRFFLLRAPTLPDVTTPFLSLKLASSMDYNHGVASELIRQNVARLLANLPNGVEVLAAAKTRTPEEVLEAVQAGIRIIGENYVKDAKEARELVGKRAKWHFIGTLQKHNVRKPALEIFDMIESVDSLEIAREIDRKCAQIGKIMPVLIEVNSGRERQKSGALPEDVERLAREISGLKNIKVMGLMTMGPRFGNPEDFRPYFSETKRIFEEIKGLKLPNVDMKYLSMGMTNSYEVAIEEGANIIRIGTRIFGERVRSS
jgi:pyridoxal phosphate enzyme (YggS family)